MLKQRIAMQDHSKEAALYYRRTLIACLAVCAMILTLLVNLYHLQIDSYQQYKTRSRDNRIKLVPVAPTRGLIYDRNGILLAENRPSYNLDIRRDQTKDLKQTVAELQKLLKLDPDQIDDFYKELRRHRRFEPVTLAEDLTEKQVAIFSVQRYRFPGASIEARLQRYYPYGSVLTHVLGYVAKINDRDLQHLEETGELSNYAGTHDIGKQGVEKYYENVLHGKVGYQEVEVNNVGKVVRTLSYHPPVPGHDIYLNIDLRLQMKAQEDLANRRGAVVMLEPKTGAVLAMASSPSYNPNPFVHGISSKRYTSLLDNPNHPLINRATQGIYAPASTVKPLMAIMGLDTGLITPQMRFFGAGYFQIPGTKRKFRDWQPWGHGWMTVYKAIEQSADTFFYNLAYKAGIDRIHKYMHLFGFGQYTGIDLHEERKGNMPSREWKQARYRQPWYQGDTISVGIGQSYWTATPLQIAHAFSVLIDHGKRIEPRLLKSIATKDGMLSPPPQTLPPIKLKNDKDWQVSLDGMYLVIQGKSGTGRRAFANLPYKAGGKSGTAQLVSRRTDVEKLIITKERHKDNALFVAFAPFNAPKALVVSIIENAGDGSSPAADIARSMLDAVMLPPKDNNRNKP
ncbi:penicillin-binding protein 2 [Dongshaea marina]|uniref:penicillin-binding protein 2 n=1 Tax=Dongshaea marina TaxID=2047966 RepID=UPI000D3E705E|nr:penicillin-binding protein 2 [Dongshaea marina]